MAGRGRRRGRIVGDGGVGERERTERTERRQRRQRTEAKAGTVTEPREVQDRPGPRLRV